MHTNFIKLNFMQLVMNSQARFIQVLVFPLTNQFDQLSSTNS